MKMARLLFPIFSLLTYSAGVYSLEMSVKANEALENYPATVEFYERGDSLYCQDKLRAGDMVEQVVITKGGLNHTSKLQNADEFCVSVNNIQYGPYLAN